MKRRIFFALSAALFPFFAFALAVDYAPQSVGAGRPEVHIKADGMVTLKSGRVEQIAGTTFYLMLRWGQLPMRFTMKTDGKTAVSKRYGGAANVSQIKLGDYLDAEGEFLVGSDFFGLNARTVKDWSLQEESGTFSGRIVEVNSGNFILQTPAQAISVRPATSTVIKKGSIVIPYERVRNGDTVVLADGVYDYASNVLTPSSIVLFQSGSDFTPRNFEGILKKMDGTAPPASLIVTVDGVDYTVYLSPTTEVLRKNRQPALLGRFVAGDTVRFYGAIQESDKTLADQLVVPAEVVRNLNL